MKIEKKRLTEINAELIIQLCNHPQVKKHMPLSKDNFDHDECEKFIEAKEKIWRDYGFGPWAYFVNDNFVGWGGLQPEDGEIEIALVLHPSCWGYGPLLFKDIIKYTFDVLNLKSVVVLLPLSRTKIKGLIKLGFEKEVEMYIDGKKFIRFRLESFKYRNSS